MCPLRGNAKRERVRSRPSFLFRRPPRKQTKLYTERKKGMDHTKRGSLTVEATLIMPVILISIMIILRMSVVHYQNIIVSAEAMRTASRAAMYWQDIGVDNPEVFQNTESAKGWITDRNFTTHDPYAVLFGGNKAKKEQNAKTYAVRMTGGTPNLLGKYTEIENEKTRAVWERGILQSYINVTVTRKNENPLGYLFDRIGFRSPDKYEITAKGIQADFVDFIRNVSFLSDIATGEFTNKN